MSNNSAFSPRTGPTGVTGAAGVAGPTGATGPQGPGGIVAKLFDSTLGSSAASIDTGENGIAGGYDVLEVWIFARTTEALAVSGVVVTLNNDSGANYDRQTLRGSNATASAVQALTNNNWALLVPGANAQSGACGAIRLSFPSYATTTFHKAAEGIVALPDSTAGNWRADVQALRWRSTAAITRMTVTAASLTDLLTGSRLLIYGR